MQPTAGFARDGFILGFRRILIIVQPVLNFPVGERTGEKRSGHSPRAQPLKPRRKKQPARHFVPSANEAPEADIRSITRTPALRPRPCLFLAMNLIYGTCLSIYRLATDMAR